jgi:hypothetical protein
MHTWGALSLPGYRSAAAILFEFWRRFRDRVAGLALCCTRPQADTPEARNTRRQTADRVLERGTEWFADLMLPKLIGQSTQRRGLTW